MYKKPLIQITMAKVGRGLRLCFIQNYINQTSEVLLIKINFQKTENSHSFPMIYQEILQGADVPKSASLYVSCQHIRQFLRIFEPVV